MGCGPVESVDPPTTIVGPKEGKDKVDDTDAIHRPLPEIPSCEICFVTYNLNENKPMNLPCGHTFCNECTSYWLTSGCPKCPLDQKPFDNTIRPSQTILELIMSKVPGSIITCGAGQSLVVPSPPLECATCRSKLACTQEAHVCAKCYMSRHGYACATCNSQICYGCNRVPTPAGRACICGKEMKFTQVNYCCFLCGERRVGLKCPDCGFHLCCSCHQPPPFAGGDQCPCGGQLSFVLKKSTCSKCGQYRFGTRCEACGFRICYKCYPPPALSDYECPSGHGKLTFVADVCTCPLCNTLTSASKCPTCEFNLCYSCYSITFPILANDGGSKVCPCGSKIAFRLEGDECIKCRQRNRGTKCRVCDFFVCYKCAAPEPISKSACLCGGKLGVSPGPCVCAQCGNYLPGRKCQDCEFHLCNECFGKVR